MLGGIKDAILKDARKEGEAEIRKAEEELEAEFSKVRTEGEAKVRLSEEDSRKLVESERRERLSWAKLEAKRVLADARETAVAIAIQDLMERMDSFVGSREYVAKIKPLVSSVIEELGGKAVVHVKKGERRLFSFPNATVVEDADILGGAVVESRDGRLKVDLSLEELVDARRDALRKDIYARLFSDDKGSRKG